MLQSTLFMPQERPSAAIQRVRTLVVDDFASMQQALTACAESVAGVEVVGTAFNGKEALDKTALLKPDLVIVDLQMPVMDGFQLMRHLRRDYPHVRLVAVCGMASQIVEREALSAGADAFVAKTTLPQGLVTKLEAVLL
jgi:two-component system, chemotaxis family, protein-glutamate methylesterase/glutaminase